MKIDKTKLAKILAELPDWIDQVTKWESLSFHEKLTYICEAERIIKALRIFKKKEIWRSMDHTLTTHIESNPKPVTIVLPLKKGEKND